MINKSQGQSQSHVQLYVAISKVCSRSGLKILIDHQDNDDTISTTNVYKEVFNFL